MYGMCMTVGPSHNLLYAYNLDMMAARLSDSVLVLLIRLLTEDHYPLI